MQTAYEYVDARTGQNAAFTPDAVTLQDHNRWSGLRLEQWEGNAGEVNNVVLPRHGVIVNIGETTDTTVRWSGQRRLSGLYRTGTTMINPARLPYDADGRGYFRGLVMAVAPESLRTMSPGQAEVELVPQFSVDDPFIASVARVLAQDVRDNYPAGPMYGEAIEAALNAHLVRHYATRSAAPARAEGLSEIEQERVRTYLLDQLDEDLRLADLARLVQLDVHGFARRFKRTFGVPPHQFVLRARIERAKSLLRDTSAPLVDIALQCGFSSHSHFTTVFRRQVGVRPRDYRAATNWRNPLRVL
ncbi:helix-turn-helix domain-containing protein [Cupriavidus basilensis]|uniref:helix-turn-helix domain-containing protein n=1 Tax=Cupriavidus basilensis TaxID=68895 RepID=UPI0020A69DA8|nr:AraC family transcriptional regulator [Cupriavidus basilensis]MCP3018850.1 AraC family transcriptional regulator [Cupriavidus basilensis]